MIINFQDNIISSEKINSDKFYNIKDIKIIFPEEFSYISGNAYIDNKEFNLIEEKEHTYIIEIKNEYAVKQKDASFKLKINDEETNILKVNFNGITPFECIYDLFFDKITDDMYMELTKEETYSIKEGLFIEALQHFEFPRVNIYDFDREAKRYNIQLSLEEMDIIATYMVMHWLGQQLASVENTRMKYSGSDFKFTSQANHMAKLQNLKKEYERMGFHLQRLYKRRLADDEGIMRSTFGNIMKSSL